MIRPDDPPETYNRLTAVFMTCLEREGIQVQRTKADPAPKNIDPAKLAKANEKCGHLEPEYWYTREARTNPRYVDLLHEEAKCLQEKGRDVTVGGDPVSLLYGKKHLGERCVQRPAGM